MKRLLLLPLTLLALAPLANAGMVLVQEIDQSGGPMPGKKLMTISVADEKVRVDIGKEMSTVVDSGKGTITSLLHGQKMAMMMPEGTFDSIKKTVDEQKDRPKPDLKATGKKETINGFECEEYVGKIGDAEATFWVTSEVEGQQAILDQLNKLPGGGGPFQGTLANGEKFPGFPIRTTIKTPQLGTSTMTVVSIKDAEVPASAFETPSDYKSMSMPKMQNPGGGAPSIPAAPDAR